MKARVLLVGDSRQHTSVERGDALRLIERYSEVKVSSLKHIIRQNPQAAKTKALDQGKSQAEAAKIYREVSLYQSSIKDLSQGKSELAWSKFIEMGIVKEGEDTEKALLNEFRESIKTKKTLLIIPRRSVIDQMTEKIRTNLKEHGELSQTGVNKQILASLSRTTAEKYEYSTYKKGEVVRFLKTDNVHDFKRGTDWTVVAVKDEDKSLVLKSGNIEKTFKPEHSQAKSIDVCRPKDIEISKGERIILTSNVETSGKKITKGSIASVYEIFEDGSIEIDNGLRLSKEFKDLKHGYAITSVSAQGPTCDHAIVYMNATDGKAISLNQMYVSCSRGRESLSIYTDDLKAVRAMTTRESARKFGLGLLDQYIEQRNKAAQLKRSQAKEQKLFSFKELIKTSILRDKEIVIAKSKSVSFKYEKERERER